MEYLTGLNRSTFSVVTHNLGKVKLTVAFAVRCKICEIDGKAAPNSIGKLPLFFVSENSLHLAAVGCVFSVLVLAGDNLY